MISKDDLMVRLKVELDHWLESLNEQYAYDTGCCGSGARCEEVVSKADFDAIVGEFRNYATARIPLSHGVSHAASPFGRDANEWSLRCEPHTGGGWGARTFTFYIHVER
jgi:hypothetical protein